MVLVRWPAGSKGKELASTTYSQTSHTKDLCTRVDDCAWVELLAHGAWDGQYVASTKLHAGINPHVELAWYPFSVLFLIRLRICSSVSTSRPGPDSRLRTTDPGCFAKLPGSFQGSNSLQLCSGWMAHGVGVNTGCVCGLALASFINPRNKTVWEWKYGCWQRATLQGSSW